MKRESFVFYESFGKAIDKLPEEEQLKAYRGIKNYALYGIEPEGEGLFEIVYGMAKPQIDANNQRYENGKKGGAPNGNQNASKQPKNNLKTTEIQPKNNQKQPRNNQKTTKKQPNVNVNVNVNDNENVNVNANDNVNVNGNVNALSEKTSKESMYFPNDEELEKAFSDFIEHRKIIKSPMSDLAIQKLITKLERLSDGDNDKAIAILNESISQGWKGIFPLKGEGVKVDDVMEEMRNW